jgi:hypothetical protein
MPCLSSIRCILPIRTFYDVTTTKAQHPLQVAATKLVRGVITREEFEHIAAVQVIVDSMASPAKLPSSAPVLRSPEPTHGSGVRSDAGGAAAANGERWGRGGREANWSGGGGATAVPTTCTTSAAALPGPGRTVIFQVPPSVHALGCTFEQEAGRCTVLESVAAGGWADGAGLRSVLQP